MNADIVPSPFSAHKLTEPKLTIRVKRPANDARRRGHASTFGPEARLCVRFDGLSADDAVRALRSFPGAARFALAER